MKKIVKVNKKQWINYCNKANEKNEVASNECLLENTGNMISDEITDYLYDCDFDDAMVDDLKASLKIDVKKGEVKKIELIVRVSKDDSLMEFVTVRFLQHILVSKLRNLWFWDLAYDEDSDADISVEWYPGYLVTFTTSVPICIERFIKSIEESGDKIADCFTIEEAEGVEQDNKKTA